MKATAKSKKAVQLNILPPTENAAAEHLKRVYLQIQLWLGHEAKPEDLGWKNCGNILKPIPISKAPAPEVLLKTLFCNCKTTCTACSCKKSGLFCTEACNCNSTSCLNSPPIDADEDEDEFNSALQMELNLN